MTVHRCWILVVHKPEADWFVLPEDRTGCRCHPGLPRHFVARNGHNESQEWALLITGTRPDFRRLFEQLNPIERLVLFGYAGALSLPLEPGSLIYPTEIGFQEGDDVYYQPAIQWEHQSRPPGVYFVPLISVEQPVLHRKERERFHHRTGAWAVDMESYPAFEAYNRINPGWTLQIIRMILDGPQETIHEPGLFARVRHRSLLEEGDDLRTRLFRLVDSPVIG